MCLAEGTRNIAVSYRRAPRTAFAVPALLSTWRFQAMISYIKELDDCWQKFDELSFSVFLLVFSCTNGSISLNLKLWEPKFVSWLASKLHRIHSSIFSPFMASTWCSSVGGIVHREFAIITLKLELSKAKTINKPIVWWSALCNR